MSDLKAVLLDVDGTLIDSNDAHANSWVEALAEFGHEVPFDRIRALIGKGGDKLLPNAIGVEKDSIIGKEISERRTRIFKKKYLPRLRGFGGARELLERMRRDDLALVVATSARPDEMKPLLAVIGAEQLIDGATSSEDVERSKPDPDIVQEALARARCSPSEAIMIGDTPYDVEASRKAGVRIIALRCGGWDDDALAGAVAIFDDPSDLLRNYAESPLGRR